MLALPSDVDPEFAELLAGSDWLESEIMAHIEHENVSPDKSVAGVMAKLDRAGAAEKAAETKSLFWYKNGTLTEAVDAEPIDMGQARASVFGTLVNYYDESGEQLTLSQAISHYNGKLRNSPEMQIKDFNLIITDKTRGMKEEYGTYTISVEGVVAGDGSTSGKNVASMQRIIASWLDDDFYAAATGVGKAVLENHDIQHGDVADYTHDVALSLAGSGTVRSKEADIETKTDELKVELGDFFRDTFISSNRNLDRDELDSILSVPVNVSIDENGAVSFDDSTLDIRLSGLIQKTFAALNERVASDDPFGDGFSEKLPPSLSRSLELLCGIRDDLDRIHDPEMKKQVNFTLDLSRK